MIVPLELGKHPTNYYFRLEETVSVAPIKHGTPFDDKKLYNSIKRCNFILEKTKLKNI